MESKEEKLKRLYGHSKIELEEYMIKDLFSNENLKKIKVDKEYQRNYIWDYNEASNLIETIILKAIVPSFIAMQDKDEIVIIDGKQRYKSIKDFYQGRFKLKQNGLNKVNPLDGRKFEELPKNVRKMIEEYKIQILVYKVDELLVTQEEKEFLQRDIYRRYNYGKTQLKEHEVERAKYLYDGLTQEFVSLFRKEEKLYEQYVDILLTKTRKKMNDDRDKISLLMLTIREMLVLPYIPMLGQKTIKNGSLMTNKYYEMFFMTLSETERKETVIEFQKIVSKLLEIKRRLQADNHELQDNVMFYKAIYWLLSILYKNHSNEFYHFNVDRLCRYVEKGGEIYFEIYNNFTRDSVVRRYEYLADYIQNELELSLDSYMKWLKEKEERINVKVVEEINPNEDWKGVQADKQLVSYPEKLHMSEIIEHIGDNRFIVQPEYQRAEVKDKIKASRMIESIMLGVKLPPVYIYHIVPENGLYQDIMLDRTAEIN